MNTSIPKVPNRDCRPYIQARKPFVGSNLYGAVTVHWDYDHINDHYHNCRTGYAVYSYGEHWPLWYYDDATAQWFGNEDKCSRTTTKHMSQTYPTYDASKIQWLPVRAMRILAGYGYQKLVAKILAGEVV